MAKSNGREQAGPTNLNAGTKRKRSDVDESDPKFKEFMEVMQPASKSKTWATDTIDESAIEPPSKVQAIELPEGESDGEYEAVPKKPRKKSPILASIPVKSVPEVVTEAQAQREEAIDATVANATDDDWLRSRTNRLLDLMAPEEITISSGTNASTKVDAMAETKTKATEEPEKPANDEEIPFEGFANEAKPDPTIEAIKSSGRLFVRNLPYSATEDDLREHFAPYGALEEVWAIYSLQPVMFHDEFPDRDSLCLGI
jgi:multiple RNA-binding domain-containing protein 1